MRRSKIFERFWRGSRIHFRENIQGDLWGAADLLRLSGIGFPVASRQNHMTTRKTRRRLGMYSLMKGLPRKRVEDGVVSTVAQAFWIRTRARRLESGFSDAWLTCMMAVDGGGMSRLFLPYPRCQIRYLVTAGDRILLEGVGPDFEKKKNL
jgi:hypothetical protein